MIHKVLMRILRVAIVGMGVLLICMAAEGEGAQESGAKDIPEGFQLLPRIGISMEYGGFIVNQENYTSALRRRLEVDVFQYRRHIFYIDFEEKTFFGIPGNSWEFNLMKYDVTLAGYRYDFGDFYVGFFVHHQCNNPIHTEDYHTLVDRERANTYMAGLEFLTKNMRIGMKDRGINFDSPNDCEFLGRFAGGLWLSKVFTRENIILDWDFKGSYYISSYGASCICELGTLVEIVPRVAEVGVQYPRSSFLVSRTRRITKIYCRLIAKNSLLAGGMESLTQLWPDPNGKGCNS